MEHKMPFYFSKVNAISGNYNLSTDCIDFCDILSMNNEDFESSYHFNYLFDVDWLVDQYPINQRSKKIYLICGERHAPQLNKIKYPNVHIISASLPVFYGTHHSKMSILFYQKSCRIIIHTANLIPFDWDNMTQMIWLSPYLQRELEHFEETSDFHNDLIRYIVSYKLGTLNPLVLNLKRTDMRSIRAKLVYSVPGYHHGEDILTNGHMKLRNILKHGANNNKSNLLICQFSSIGSLGSNDNWIREEFGQSLTGESHIPLKSRIKLIYPTIENIQNSLKAIQSGCAFPYNRSVHTKQLYIKDYFCKWVSDKNFRTRAAPHLKYYISVSENYSIINWFLLTSANFSKAAWGVFQKNKTQLCIRSYEIGVLELPKSYECEYFIPYSLSLSADSNTSSIGCLVPPDLPLQQYEDKDDPWTIQ